MRRICQVITVLFVSTACLRADVKDLFSDTWTATDALGRKLPVYPEVTAPRPDRTVGIFYFLWHGAHTQGGGPFDISKILATDPDAMQKPGSPLWGPLHAPHHWGESIFGYYLTRDEAVLRKHAQMLADAGVDVVVFDVTNQITYLDDYMTLLRVWAHERELGNRTPQVAFLTPFWAPAKVTRELWRDLYSTGIYRDLWFQWEGKPLILADPDLLLDAFEQAHQSTPVELRAGHTLGQRFSTDQKMFSVAGRFPTWNKSDSSITLTLRRDGPGGEQLATRRFANVQDNSWLRLSFETPLPAGTFYLEASDAEGQIGWWSDSQDRLPNGAALADGKVVEGDRTLRIEFENDELRRILNFFTFRKPQPDYFKEPTQPNMWSWLEVYPQHRFTNSSGVNEQMSVGVAQNAVNGRLGSMSEPGAHGRSYHNGSTDQRPNAVRYGFNVQEQWERALREDPEFIFVTGWNEWIAGRFAEFNGVKLPVMFVDQFDQEHSRDIEPMAGGHGDDYYWQLVSYIRKYKGARPLQHIKPKLISIDGAFDDWKEVGPEFADTIGDPVHRQNRGWNPNVLYQNDSGRNDIIEARFTFDKEHAYFYARTRDLLTSSTDTNWMSLLIDIDADASTGWLGYDYIVNYPETGSISRHSGKKGSFQWSKINSSGLKLLSKKNELELSISWKALGRSKPVTFEFKWADNCLHSGDWTDFTLNGDAAPNDRYNYRAILQ
jgi:hypothetical protein